MTSSLRFGFSCDLPKTCIIGERLKRKPERGPGTRPSGDTIVVSSVLDISVTLVFVLVYTSTNNLRRVFRLSPLSLPVLRFCRVKVPQHRLSHDTHCIDRAQNRHADETAGVMLEYIYVCRHGFRCLGSCLEDSVSC